MDSVSFLVAFALVLVQSASIGSALHDGLQLVYESGGVEQAPWTYDSVRVVHRPGFDRCLIVARRSQPPRESCTRGDTLFESRSTGTHMAVRPIGPRMSLTISAESGTVSEFTTQDLGIRQVGNGLRVDVLRTTIVTRDPTGKILRRLREDYAPSFLTAVWGVFEEPDDTGGWRSVREFTLHEVRNAGP